MSLKKLTKGQLNLRFVKAVRNLHWDEAKELLRYGATPNAEDGAIVAIPILMQNMDMLKYMVESPNIKEYLDIQKHSETLILGCKQYFPGYLEAFEYLTSKGLKLTKGDESEFIDLAIKKGSLDGVKSLFKVGFKSSNLKEVALMHAVDKEDYPIMDFLIENGSDVQFQKNYFLRRAIDDENNKLTEYLISKGASLDNAFEFSKGDLQKTIERMILVRNLERDLPVKEENKSRIKL